MPTPRRSSLLVTVPAQASRIGKRHVRAVRATWREPDHEYLPGPAARRALACSMRPAQLTGGVSWLMSP